MVLFAGTVFQSVGMVVPQSEMLGAFVGKFAPFVGKFAPFVGNFAPFVGQVVQFVEIFVQCVVIFVPIVGMIGTLGGIVELLAGMVELLAGMVELLAGRFVHHSERVAQFLWLIVPAYITVRALKRSVLPAEMVLLSVELISPCLWRQEGVACGALTAAVAVRSCSV